MIQVEFFYNESKTIIECNLNEKIINVCENFSNKFNVDKNNLYFCYDGKAGIQFNEKLSIEEMINLEDKKRNKLNILVFKNEFMNGNIKSKSIICPKCKESIRMNIVDYKINLFECKNGHKIEKILLDKFEKTQNIDGIQIKCELCKEYNKSNTHNNIFYRCYTCKMNICPLCQSNHDKMHKIINYDEKYYICNKHNENYNSYCEESKMNLCKLCDEHKLHNIIYFEKIMPNKNDLIELKNSLKNEIHLFNHNIKLLINILEDVKNKINIYYKINEEIINNFIDNNNLNYEIIYYLKSIENNYKVLYELNAINGFNIINKFKNIYNLYNKMNNNEINIKYKVNKNDKEIRLFGEYFARRYKKICKIEIEGKEYELKEKHNFSFFSKKSDILEIKLKEIINIINANDMFRNCPSLLSLPDISNLIAFNIIDMSRLFYGCESLSFLDNISNWNTSNVTNMDNMFSNCSSLQLLPDISKWNTSNVTNMSCMFYECKSLSSLPDISQWNTSKVSDMSSMLGEIPLLSSLPDISQWNTSNVTNMGHIFGGCISLLSLPDISIWNISNVTNMSGMFYNCESLKILPDISKWNTSNVTDMHRLFYNCKSLQTLPDISKWNISNIINMSEMFYDCSSLISLPDISKWDTSNIKYSNMKQMFYGVQNSLNIPPRLNYK